MSKKEIKRINNLIREHEWQIILEESEIGWAMKFPNPEEEVKERSARIKEHQKRIEELKNYKGEMK